MTVTDTQVKTFLQSSITDMFGVTIPNLVNYIVNNPNYCANSRFYSQLATDPVKITQVLTSVQAQGMSPVWFAAYEFSEGISQYGWLNHTYPQGDTFQDAIAVAQEIVSASNNPNLEPSWADTNPKTYWDGVPQNVKDAGNADFKVSFPVGTIGHGWITETAASCWAYYYPQALSGSVNGTQDYANNFRMAVGYILEGFGGTIDGKAATAPQQPTNPGKSTGNNTPSTPAPTVATSSTIKSTPIYLNSSLPTQYKSNFKLRRYNEHLIPNIVGNTPAEQSTQSSQTAADNSPTVPTSKNPTSPNTASGVTSADMDWLKGLIGTTVGYPPNQPQHPPIGTSDGTWGQCYGLAEVWAIHLGAPVEHLGGGYPQDQALLAPGSDTTPGMSAVNIAADYPWSTWGFSVIHPCTQSDVKAGDIVCIQSPGNGYAPAVGGVNYGHVVVSTGNNSIEEQNMTVSWVTTAPGGNDPLSGHIGLSDFGDYLWAIVRKGT